ncbi:MAG: septum formation protein Maf [Clostridia bacterium]|nr:septum formation protein Maf [Clostridia bacterium]
MAFFIYLYMKVILASNSPRRKELFSKICPSFVTFPAGVDESVPQGTSPCDTVKILSRRKAEYVFERALSTHEPKEEPLVVLGSDTVVACDGIILGKPKDEKEAFKMLKALSGRTHFVYTGVCFVNQKGVYVEADVSEVAFHALTDEEIYDYIATGSPMDKAGAYGIQDGNLVKGYKGSYTNIVGLPLELTEKMYNEVVKKC